MADYWDQFKPLGTLEDLQRGLPGRQMHTGGAAPVPDRQLHAPTTPPQTNPGTPGPTRGTNPGDPRAFIQQWQATHPPTRQSYEDLIAKMIQAGFQVERPTRAGGAAMSGDKIVIRDPNNPFSPVFDLISDEGGPNAAWGFSPDGFWGEGRPASDPFGGAPRPDGGGSDPMNSPLLRPYGQQFTGTDPQKIADSPAFKFRMEQGMGALERSAAAKGTSLTGGTLKDLTQFAQGLASTEFDNQFNRDLSSAGFNRDTHWGDQNNAFNKLADFSNMGLNASNTLGDFGSQYGNNVGRNADAQSDLQTGQGDANAASRYNEQNATNGFGASVANALGQIDWSKIFRRSQPGMAGNPGGYSA